MTLWLKRPTKGMLRALRKSERRTVSHMAATNIRQKQLKQERKFKYQKESA